MIVLEHVLVGGFPGREMLWGSLAEGVKSAWAPRPECMAALWALDSAASGLLAHSVGMWLSEYCSWCMGNVLFESGIAHTSLLCLEINCH